MNNDYREQLEAAGLGLTGLSPDRELVEMVELSDHPYFIGCQFHPEFKSKPHRAHPLFTSFVKAALSHRRDQQNATVDDPSADDDPASDDVGESALN